MKYLYIFVFLFISGTSVGLAQQTPLNTSCTDSSKLDWEMNSEPDIAKYRIYVKDTAGMQSGDTVLVEFSHDPSKVIFDRDGIGHFQHILGINLSEGDKWFAATAVDASNNESIFSNEIGCSLNMSPAAPSGFLITKKNMKLILRIKFKAMPPR